MNNDKIYCFHCKRVFRDKLRQYKYYKVQDTKLEDSKFNPRYKNICPYCLGVNTKNVNKLLLFGDSMKRAVGSLGNWNERRFYKEVKRVVKSKPLNTAEDK